MIVIVTVSTCSDTVALDWVKMLLCFVKSFSRSWKKLRCIFTWVSSVWSMPKGPTWREWWHNPGQQWHQPTFWGTNGRKKYNVEVTANKSLWSKCTFTVKEGCGTPLMSAGGNSSSPSTPPRSPERWSWKTPHPLASLTPLQPQFIQFTNYHHCFNAQPPPCG